MTEIRWGPGSLLCATVQAVLPLVFLGVYMPLRAQKLTVYICSIVIYYVYYSAMAAVAFLALLRSDPGFVRASLPGGNLNE